MMDLTRRQQAVLDACEDGEMRSSDLLSDFPERSNKSIMAILKQLRDKGLIEVRRVERVLIDTGVRPMRKRTVWVFALTALGLDHHAPPPDWPSDPGAAAFDPLS